MLVSAQLLPHLHALTLAAVCLYFFPDTQFEYGEVKSVEMGACPGLMVV